MSDFIVPEFDDEQIKKELDVNENGQGFATIRACARLAGVSVSTLIRQFSPDHISGSKLAQMLIQYGFNPIVDFDRGIPKQALVIILEFYTYRAGKRCTNRASSALHFYKKNGSFNDYIYDSPSKKIKVNPERKKQISLTRKYGLDDRSTEINTEAGRIDLLTSDQVIEIKAVALWKSAIGQVLVYGAYYPNHLKHIYLFGASTPKMRQIISKHCEALNIIVTFDRTNNE